MNVSDLNFGHLRYFWAVAHDGTMSRAARALRVSQSALSVQIRQLEDSLGQPLFERRGRRLELTEAGRVALDHADAIFAIGAELVGTFDAGESRRREVRVGALATLSRNFQLAFLEPILGREDVVIRIRSGATRELLAALEAHELDVVLTDAVPGHGGAVGWVAHRIASQPVALVATAARARRAADWRELMAHEPLVVPSPGSSIRAELDALWDRLGITPRIAAEVDDMAMLRVLARADLGAAVVPPIVVRGELAAGDLVEVAILADLSETFHALAARRRFPNPLLRELLVPARGARAGRARRVPG